MAANSGTDICLTGFAISSGLTGLFLKKSLVGFLVLDASASSEL